MSDADQTTGAQPPPLDVAALQRRADRLWSRDISAQLKLSEAKYRALVEGSSDFIYVLDRDGRFTFANAEVENLLGYRPEELIGQHFSAVLHPPDCETLGRAFHERRTGERATHRLEIRLRSKLGDTRDVELDVRHFAVSASGIYQDRTFVGTHGVARDITERKYQQTKAAALQVVREAVWSMARGDDIQLVLDAVRASVQHMGLLIHAFCVGVVDADDPPSVELYGPDGSAGIHRVATLMVTESDALATELLAVWRKGQLRYRREPIGTTAGALAAYADYLGEVGALVQAPFSHGVLLLPGGAGSAFTPRHIEFVQDLCQVLSEGFHRRDDLQELTRSEKRYRTLVETPNLVVMLLDGQGDFLYVSPQIQSWLGIRPDELYADAQLLERIVHPEDRAAVRAFWSVAATPAPREIEFRWRPREGQYLWALGSQFPVYESPDDEDLGRVGMLQVVVQDITERKRSQEQVQRSLAEKEILLREIHHRVKNNLQIISSLLHLQSGELADSRVQAVFEDSQHRINSMALIHEELYTSGDLGQVDFSAYVHRLVRNLQDSYTTTAGGRIGLDVEVAALPLSLDRAIPLGLIINELVANALKYAFADGRAGRVRVTLSQRDGGQLDLVVADDGVGLPAGLVVGQLHSLGLRLVEALVRQLHGALQIDNDGGARFTIRCG